MPEAMRELSLEEAVRVFEAMPRTLLPATLHPRYLAADATRNVQLQPLFLLHESQGERWLHGVHTTSIEGTPWRDASSPYGYGGPIATSADTSFVREAWMAYETHMRSLGVVAEFLRFHPLSDNHEGYPGEVSAGRQVVTMDLSSDGFASLYPARLQQVVRKASRAGLVYEEHEFTPFASRFGEFHRAAMLAMQADPFYIFDDAYFAAMGATGRARLGLVRAPGTQEWLAAALFLDGKGVREYHLAAGAAEGRRVGAPSLLVHEAALAARAKGCSHMYLGGGTDAKEDNPLLFFKGGFSPLRFVYRTGAWVFDNAARDELKERFASGGSAHPERPIFWRKV